MSILDTGGWDDINMGALINIIVVASSLTVFLVMRLTNMLIRLIQKRKRLEDSEKWKELR